MVARENPEVPGYPAWTSSGPAENHRYLLPAVLAALPREGGRQVLDIGCGNGTLTAELQRAGWEPFGIDFTPSGIDAARRSFPDIEFAVHDIAQPLPPGLRGRFDEVVAAEVIEHLFSPQQLLDRAREALVEGGHIVVSTPFHGYWKNLALAATGRLDHHWQVASDYGHIKFFSERTLDRLLRNNGFVPVRWARAGHFVRPLAATMIVTARLSRPPEPPKAL